MALSNPSSPDPVYTPGTARGAKLAALLVDAGTSLVRKIFEAEVQKMNPPSLRQQLEKYRGCLYDGHKACDKKDKKHKKHFKLYGEQKKTLYPDNGVSPDNTQGFDITLLECLMKELVWLELGRDAQKSTERDRLRRFRNANYGHIKSTDLSEGEFDRLWNELTEILVALGGKRDKISDRRNRSIDPELEVKYFSLLEKLYKEDIIACLKDHYATEYAHVRPLPWCEDLNLHLGEVYTNLQLQQRDDRGHFKDTGTIVSLADIYMANEGEDSHINIRSAVRKIRVEGDPGIGKSCSCQKLAYDWSCGELERFKVVFFLEMRHLVGNVKDEIVEQSLIPKDTKTTRDELWSYIEENQDDVLFILDGLDELSQTAREVTDVVDLIQGKILRNCHVLVTSRPYHCVEDVDKCHQFYRIVGYTKENSAEFIRKYFCNSPESASKLVELIHSNRNLSELVVNPLNNVLICEVWEENNSKLPSSKAELYELIVLSVAKRFCTKKSLPMEGDQLPPEIEEALRGLGNLSWDGLEQEQLQFNIAEITRKYGTTADNMLNMGLLTRDYSFSRIKRTCYCALLHKTFQEYMAARYISGLVTKKRSREEGMTCIRSLFGLTKAYNVNWKMMISGFWASFTRFIRSLFGFTNASDIDRSLILSSRRKYREIQNMLPSILGEKAGPLFDMFAEELRRAQTDEDRAVLSFLCITFLGKTSAGGKMAEIVASFLPQHLTNNEGDLSEQYDHIDWFAGLTHVLTCQKKLSTCNNPRLIQHLTVDCGHITASSSEQEKLDLLENTLSDNGKIRSVTLLEAGGGTRQSCHNFSLHTFIPGCGTESLSIFINPGFTLYLSLRSSLEQLSEAPMVENIRITVGGVTSDMFGPDVDFSEYDRLLAHMISRQSSLRSIRLEIFEWHRNDPDTRGFGNLTATLQSISEHACLQNVELDLPRNDILAVSSNVRFGVFGMVNKLLMVKYKIHETFNVEPMVHELTECIKKNNVLKTLRLRWKLWGNRNITNKVYHGVCSSQSLSSLCSAIQRNRTLETLVIDGMLSESQSGPQAEIVANLLGNKPSNYKELNITMFSHTFVEDFVMFPASWTGQ
uniref:NACHT domain-containing protein n=1 Tax=Branchiostoma floridae TaxID=7739 RepID=C3ZRQ1_BRAFL|eukprot:XP_002588840.1 hypothetical protein BRAFLDRAFT_99540 [Branchiostoma floridae]